MKCSIVIVIVILPIFLQPGNIIWNGYGKGDGNGGATSFMVAAAADADGEAEKKYKAVFVADIKRLLDHNHLFYNTYGAKDTEVDLAFDEAKIAAEVIFLYPQFFREKIRTINFKIEDALKKKEMTKEDEDQLYTADGVPVFFIDNRFLLIGTLGGMGIIRFPHDFW